MVFYLKYRPKKLSELDNQDVSSLMEKYLSRDTVSHAFLFTGPRGTGKTSTARITAKMINCQSRGKDNQACNKCSSCESINLGSNLDILEIDAASNRGIDEIRDLREKIKLTPSSLKYKVYIIDEVHMLTTEAFNALLKTLEEPPLHAIFILATTEAQKVPETIMSRCIRINFRKATVSEIIHSLKRIVRGEDLEVEDSALEEIAKNADGSFRDAAKILEEMTLDKSKITLDMVHSSMKTTDKVLEKEFIEKLKIKSGKELLEIVVKLNTEGKNIRQFFINILTQLNDLLIEAYGASSDWDKGELIRALNIFADGFSGLKTAVIASLPLEMAIVEFCEDYKIVEKIPQEKEADTIGTDATVIDSHVLPIADKWPEILDVLKPLNHSMAGVLRSCKPVFLKDKTLTIEAAYKFHGERISDPKTRETIAQVIKSVCGIDVGIKTIIKKR